LILIGIANNVDYILYILRPWTIIESSVRNIVNVFWEARRWISQSVGYICMAISANLIKPAMQASNKLDIFRNHDFRQVRTLLVISAANVTNETTFSALQCESKKIPPLRFS